MELKDLAVDMFDNGGVATIVLGSPLVEKVQKLKPIEKVAGIITNQTLFMAGNFINKAIIGGVDDKGEGFIKEFVYVGKQSTLISSSAGKTMPSDAFEKFKAYIASHNWRDAKTSATFSPHQYIINEPCWKLKADGKCRKDCDRCRKERAEFEHWVMFIREWGEKVVYGRNNYVCLRVDDKHYWTGGEVLETTWVLNRAITNDPRYKVPMRWVERGE